MSAHPQGAQPTVFLPHHVHLPSGRIVRAGRYPATLTGDGQAVIRVRRFMLPEKIKFNDRWPLPMGGGAPAAAIVLPPGWFEMDGQVPV